MQPHLLKPCYSDKDTDGKTEEPRPEQGEGEQVFLIPSGFGDHPEGVSCHGGHFNISSSAPYKLVPYLLGILICVCV